MVTHTADGNAARALRRGGGAERRRISKHPPCASFRCTVLALGEEDALRDEGDLLWYLRSLGCFHRLYSCETMFWAVLEVH